MQRRLLFSPTFLLLGSTVASASNPPPAPSFSKKEAGGLGFMPRGHWAYDVASALVATGLLDASVAARLKSPAGVTRYEFALWTIEILNSESESYQMGDVALRKAIQKKFPGKEMMWTTPSGEVSKITPEDCLDAYKAMLSEFGLELHILAARPLVINKTVIEKERVYRK